MIFTVAIDGPAAAGKGTISRAVAARFGLAHLDTGLLYRAVAAMGGDPVAAARALTEADLVRPGLRTLEAGQAASRVATIPEVRAALTDFQRRFARRRGGAVLDGRDIGTVICPEAEVKLYVTASAQVRAHRRWLEVGGDEAKVLAEVRERDARDMGRADAPLRAAADAVVLDTSEMGIEEAVETAVAVVERELESRGFSDFGDIADAMNARGHAGGFAKDGNQRPKAEIEMDVASEWRRSALTRFGLNFDRVLHNPNDPPDIFAEIGGLRKSVELTELVDGALIDQLSRESQATGRRVTSHHGAHFWAALWDETKFRRRIDEILDTKNRKYALRNLHIDYLVIYTDEAFLSPPQVETWLASGRFVPRSHLGDAHLLLNYVPGREPTWPLFSLV